MKFVKHAVCAILTGTLLTAPGLCASAGELSTGVVCDVTADGDFDCLDLLMLQRWLLNDGILLNAEDAADVNADGEIDIFDLALMKRILICGDTVIPEDPPMPVTEPYVFRLEDVPAYSGEPWYVIDDNTPDFSDLTAVYGDTVFEYYTPLDELGRCGVTYASICQEIMPTEERGEIGMVRPSGWMYDGKSNNNKYDFVNGKYVYNRCHLIGYQLAGENANVCNLITGTRYLNIEGMLPFEDEVADYVHKQNSTGADAHVLYRVTPIYDGENPVAAGVRMEGWSVEDQGAGVCFDVFCYNVQPGVFINYETGQNWAEEAAEAS